MGTGIARHRRIVTVLLAMALALPCLITPDAAAKKGDPNKGYRMWSSFWEVYGPDPDALGLFHLDKTNQMNVQDMELEMDLGGEEKGGAGPALPGLAADKGPVGKDAAVDSSLLRRDARVAGEYEWIEKGWRRGGLKLKGKNSALVLGQYNELQSLKSITMECWLRIEEGAEGTVFSVGGPRGKGSVMELRLKADGHLTAWCGAEKGKSSVALTPDRWWHVTMIASPGGTELIRWVPVKIPPNIRVLIDGAERMKVEDNRIRSGLGNMSGTARVGNGTAQRSGLSACFDEVRISPVARKYYPRDVTWTDPKAGRTVPAGEPYLRQESDVAFAVSFDETCTATVPEGRDGALFGASKKQEGPVLMDGVRGKAILVGPKTPRPVYDGQGLVTPERGSFEFWFRPYDWDNRKIQGFHDPMEFVPLLRVVQEPEDPEVKPSNLLAFAILHKKQREQPKPPLIHPGDWFHVVGTWEGRQRRLYLNGAPMPPSVGQFGMGKPADGTTAVRVFLDPINPRMNYSGEQTLIDELRLYSRPLTPEEVANAYQRYLPEGELKALPFAHVDASMNCPMKTVNMALELLSPKRGRVAEVSARIFGPEGDEPVVDAKLPPIKNGRTATKLKDVEVGYGSYRVEFTFLDGAGEVVDHMTFPHERPRPPWLGNTLGIHDKVLPGWTPIEVAGGTLSLWGREIALAGNGLPKSIVSQGEDMLASPVSVTLKAGGANVELKAAADAPEVESASEAAVVTRGKASGGGWDLGTRITTEFDGMMKVEMTLSGEGALDALTVELPLKTEHVEYMGFWTGARNFRASTGYGTLSHEEGVVFASNTVRRLRNKQVKGSFMPYISLADDHRGLAWFAENDRGWTKSREAPALEVVRAGEVTTLRMNVVHEKTELAEPLTIVFGLQPTPVKALPENRRGLTRTCNFGYVDSFSKQQLKSAGDYGNFNIFPEDYDWEAAAGRAKLHQFHYKGGHGYTEPILYIDRNWVGLPPDSWEYRGRWWKSGFYRYLPEARNCSIWNFNEWLRNCDIVGFYIDDSWVGTFTDPDTGPAYRLADGTVQPGFEFFDYREFMKRLRWIFHDNDMEPFIWVHMTQTHLMPALSFADVILDGEDRFLAWGDKRDFLYMWSLPRLRFSNQDKWGIPQVWMNKIGADQIAPVEMPHWEYRQQRSYYAALLVNDISNTGGWSPDALKAGCYDDAAEFIGYWDPKCPVATDNPKVVASVYKREGRAAVVITSVDKEQKIVHLTIRPELLAGKGATLDDLRIRDADTYDPPAGEDITKVEKPKGVPDKELEPERDDVADDFEDMLAEEEALEKRKKKEGFLFDDHNFEQKDGVLRLRVRAHDYRLLTISWVVRGGDDAPPLP